MRLKLVYQGSDQSIVNVQDPWLHLRDSLGVHLLPNGDAALDNGVGNAGTAGGLYVREIEVDGKPLMSPGNHYIPPRAILPIRRSGVRLDVVSDTHLPKARPAWSQIGDTLGSRTSAAIQARKAVPSLGFFFDAMGPWFPNFSGQPQPGAVSGQGIEFLPGWERNSAYRLLSADCSMHHTALSYCDAATGKPLTTIHQPKYGLSRGYAKETQLGEFCAPATLSAYDDNRVPRDVNSGSCAYKDTLTGVNRYNGCLPDDGQHLIRAFRHALAGWQVYGDPLCRFYLDVIANDAALRWGNMPTVASGQGAPWAGREVGWVLRLFQAVQHRSSHALERALSVSRMPMSLHQRCAWGLPWGFAPDPWDTGTPQHPLAPYAQHVDDVAPAIEAAIIGYNVDQVPVADALTKSGNPSHFMRVAPNRCDLDLHADIERECFNVWAVWGRAVEIAGNKQPLLSRIPTMRLPDDPKQYQDAAHLLQGMIANPHIEVLAPAIKALENL
jgi:hypothetical protein